MYVAKSSNIQHARPESDRAKPLAATARASRTCLTLAFLAITVATSSSGARATSKISGMPIAIDVPNRFIRWTRKPLPNVDVLANFAANNVAGVREGIIAIRSATPSTRTLAQSFETLKQTNDLRFIRYESHCGRPFVVIEQTIALPTGSKIIMHSELTIVHDYEDVASAEYSIGYYHDAGQPASPDVLSALRRSCVD